MNSWIDSLKFDSQGLIPAIIQDSETGQVLMMAWMNRESLLRTIELGKTVFWSRSRQKYWVKGETSGHFQWVKEIKVDCDGDTLLILVDQEGAACHEGYRTCFFRTLDLRSGEWRITEQLTVDPHQVYKKDRT